MEEARSTTTRTPHMNENTFLLFLLLTVPIIAIAITLNGLAFVVFYKKPVFRKILANR